VGELIAADDPVFWLACCQPMRVSAEVDEEDISLVQPGQKVIIRADAFPGKVMEGKVTSITPKGDPVARSYRVRVGLNEDTPLMTGMTAETNIVISEKDNALLVPAEAVRSGSVWVAKDGKLEKRTVQVGAEGPDTVEIKSGLIQGELVAAEYKTDYVDGQDYKTKIRSWTP
jgi:RND family efflux transporter MFP subunit